MPLKLINQSLILFYFVIPRVKILELFNHSRQFLKKFNKKEKKEKEKEKEMYVSFRGFYLKSSYILFM